MNSSKRRAATIVAMAMVGGLGSPALAQQAARCGGLFCDLYYNAAPAPPPGMPAPAPGQPGSIFLPCHDFICGMFGGRTQDQPVTAEAAPPETAAKPGAKTETKSRKRSTRRSSERVARNEGRTDGKAAEKAGGDAGPASSPPAASAAR